jgi:6-phosphogluconolactonase
MMHKYPGSRIRIYPDINALATGLYGYLAPEVLLNHDRKHPVNIALAGGNTPRVFYELLGGLPPGSLPWNHIHLWWGDERCVPAGHPESNYRMVRESLLNHIDIPGENVHRIRGEATPAEEVVRLERLLSEHLPLSEEGIPVFDLILLGIGEDGHTASLFPGPAPVRFQGNWLSVTQHPVSGQQRITLNLTVLNLARLIVFLVSGSSKAEVVSSILGHHPEAESLPAGRIKPVDGQLIWFLDKDAAVFLS